MLLNISFFILKKDSVGVQVSPTGNFFFNPTPSNLLLWERKMKINTRTGTYKALFFLGMCFCQTNTTK
jgi:hypothetical protein